MTLAEKSIIRFFKPLNEAPDFVIQHFKNELLKYLVSDILSDFKAKFQLKKEELWHDYLQEVMPQYKKNKSYPFIDFTEKSDKVK